MHMERDIEREIASWAQGAERLPLLIQGARRVGKTHSAEHVGRGLAGDGFVKVDFQTSLDRASALFDGPTDDVERIVSRIGEYARRPLDPATSIILFDEVQLCEKALNSLRFFSGGPWRVMATGSLLGVTVRQRRLPFPSGVKHVSMHPLTFGEFLRAMGEGAMEQAIREHVASCEPYVLHEDALELFHRYLVVGGMPRAVGAWVEHGSFERVREVQEEIDITYTADMTDPDNGISAAAAKRIWNSIPKQLLRASTKKFKYAEVERGGRRASLLEPLEWLEAAGVIVRNDLTCDVQAPLTPFNDEGGSFFKEYVADTGLMFYKFGIDPALFLDESLRPLLSADFRGALAENAVKQALTANGVPTFYWMSNGKVGNGEVDFVVQDRLARVVPLEVKSARNVRAKSMRRLVQEARSPFAVRLSEQNFAVTRDGELGCELRSLPLYAAFCLDKEYLGVLG